MGNKINLAFRTPTIRNNILNSIMKEDSSIFFIFWLKFHFLSVDSYSDKLKENIFSPIIKNNKRHVKILRSSEAVKTNINQELMNEIYFNKIMKNNNKTQEDEQQINDQFNNNLPKKLLNYKNISQNTFNNFKSLRTLMKNHVFVLDSELICKKIHEASTSFNEKLFDYSKELKIIETENKRSIGLEADLMEKYVYISQQIKQKLNIEKQIRMMNYMNNKRILTQKENVFCILIKH